MHLELTDVSGPAASFSSIRGAQLHRDSESDFNFAIQIRRAWVADPDHPVEMRRIIPDTWAKGKFLAIGERAERIEASEIGNIERLRVKEVQVLGQPAPRSGNFDTVRNSFKMTKRTYTPGGDAKVIAEIARSRSAASSRCLSITAGPSEVPT